jgi:2-polyprenyl-6-methoxyphenol hydroxylase-like FAD-dependent oxidoreductase
MKIAIIGGGPSGLFLAILLKEQLPHTEVHIYEQNPPDATFGFGVVLADAGLSNLRAGSPKVVDDLVGAMRFNEWQTIVSRDSAISIRRPGIGGGAISRITLLKILGDHARRLGAQITYNHRVTDFSSIDADLVVGADGINSQLRVADEPKFGTSRYNLTNHFAWYGVAKPFPTSTLVFRKYLGGCFVAHYYPYSESMSTFVAECDHQTWQELGMETMGAPKRQLLFEEVFAPELGGYRLVSNNSNFRQFDVIRNSRWTFDNRVLIGDAGSSAHPSIGSGTRIAMEDSIALAGAIVRNGSDILAALEDYVSVRAPAKAKLIVASEASCNWYERMREWMDAFTPHEFVYRYMMRTGRVDNARLKDQYPDLAAELERAGVLSTTTQ